MNFEDKLQTNQIKFNSLGTFRQSLLSSNVRNTRKVSKHCMWLTKDAQQRATISVNKFSSAIQLCPTFCNPTDCSTPAFPVHDQLLELAQTHVHQVSDAIQPYVNK